jgi:hypothetical protein
MKGFTKRENGHYYKEELASCPYCGHGGRLQADIPDEKRETQLYTAPREENKTRLVIDKKLQQQSNRTVFGTDESGFSHLRMA